MIDVNLIWKIDGGLSFIQKIYPSAKPGTKKFSLRADDSTPSASLYKSEKGIWYVTDFGQDSKGKNAIECQMIEGNCDFGTAIKIVAAHYNIEGVKAPNTDPRPTWESWPAKPDENEGVYTFKFKEFSLAELKTIFAPFAWASMGKNDDEAAKIAKETLAYYHYKSVEYFTKTKNGKTRKVGSTDDFPIFVIHENDFYKIYKPKDQKEYRFESYGPRPTNLIHGLEQAKKKFASLQDEEGIGNKKLREIILCTGGSDALNVSAAGKKRYSVIWLNSETAELSSYDYKQLTDIAETIYNLPDIDATGRRMAHKLALTYLDIKTIFLPDELMNKLDRRGNSCKDVRDYFAHYRNHDFQLLIENALPYRFWDEELQVDKDGVPKMKNGKEVYKFVCNNVNLYNFLYKNGFARFASTKEKDGYTYVQIENGIVRNIKPTAVKDYIHNFLETRMLPIALRNTMFNTPRLSEQSLSNLKYFVGDFKTYGADFQYFFYAKTAWKITRNGIKEEKLDGFGKNIWEHKVITHKPKVMPEMFRISKPHGDQWDIEILDESCDFFKFLIQTSRINWRIELEERMDYHKLSDRQKAEYLERYGWDNTHAQTLEQYSSKDMQNAYRKQFKFAIDGPLLTADEQAEQKQHLVNRLFAIGYALHRYKDPAKPWAVFAMDAKLSEDGESHGGAGKGIVAKALYRLLSKVQLDGRNQKLTENPHVFENITADTDIVHIEDASEYLPFNFFFAPLTSAMTINPKNKQSFELQFDESPKFWFDTNYGDRYTDPSSLRRKLYTVFGDYYHENNGEYRETRTPTDDLGRALFTDWTESDWQLFYNFMAQCLAFYLSVDEKISPPMYNVSKRNLMSEMGDHFREWADIYFDRESQRLNTLIEKKLAFNDMVEATKLKTFTAHRFMKSLKAWAKFNDLELNPEELKNSSGRIIRRKGSTTEECIYLRTPGAQINDMAF